MVNPNHISEQLDDYFYIDGAWDISPDGTVNVQGDVRMIKSTLQLPVQFGTVSGAFDCEDKTLTSLVGSPHHVGGNFWCNENWLTSLVGAPTHVGGSFVCENNKLSNLVGAPSYVGMGFFCTWNKLTSLEGAPAHAGENVILGECFQCDYHMQLPLLRLLNYHSVNLKRAPVSITRILKKYAGQGKKAALSCAAELIKAGHAEDMQFANYYKDNARW
jgi:hypothetical protein